MRPKLASVCPPASSFEVLDVDTLSFPGVADATFRETKDHAKWAISTSSSTPLACQSDMNHQQTQYARGGGECAALLVLHAYIHARLFSL